MKRLLGALVALLLTAPAHGQSVQQSGSITPGHLAKWITNGVIGDVGSSGTVATILTPTVAGQLICAVNTTGQLVDCAPLAANSILVGTGAVPASKTWTQWFDLVCGSAQGNIVYRGASGWNCLPPGSNGFVLATQGAGANPVWTSAPTTVPQPANTVYAGPTSGGTAGPTFRSLVVADLPSVASKTILGNRTSGAAPPTTNYTASSLDTTIAAVNGSITSGHISCFNDTVGTVRDCGVNFVTNSFLSQAAANTFKGNPTASTANVQDFTITSLTQKVTPSTNDAFIISDQSASGQFKYITLGSFPAPPGTLLAVPKGAAYTIQTGDKGTSFNNSIASSSVPLTLPACSTGLYYEGYVAAGWPLSFVAAGTDVISAGAMVTATGGNVVSDVVGSKIRLFCEVAGLWSALISGNWTVN